MACKSLEVPLCALAAERGGGGEGSGHEGAGGQGEEGEDPGAPAPGGEDENEALFILSPNCLQKLEAIQLVQF